MAEQEGSVDPQRLSIDQAAKVMAAALKRRIDAEKVRQRIEDGAPTNGDGTLSLVQARMQRPIVAEMDWGRRRGPIATRAVWPASEPERSIVGRYDTSGRNDPGKPTFSLFFRSISVAITDRGTAVAGGNAKAGALTN